MRWPRVVVFLFGIFSLAMAIKAYFFPSDKPSPISLVAAGGIGILVLYFGFIIPAKPRLGYIGTTVAALVTALSMVSKMLKGVIFPSTVTFVVSVLVILALSYAHMSARKEAKTESAP